MKKKSLENDEVIQTASRIASIISIFLIVFSTVLYIYLVVNIEKVSLNLSDHADGLKVLKSEAEDELISVEDEHFRTVRQAWRKQQRWKNNNNNNNNNMSGRRKSHLDEPKICDCTVIDCPKGPRGPPGEDGRYPNDGLPGEPGKDGTDGIYQVDEPDCPPCPQGPPGEDGLRGDPGEPGRPGIPGDPGIPGTNEPGTVGPAGSRGQSGRAGPKGDPGEAGQDFVQLVGLPGAKGGPGSIGLPGARGDPGNNGKPAPPGSEGFPGPVGETGDHGEYGLRGIPGRKGPPGKDGGYCQCPPREGASFQQNVKVAWSGKNQAPTRAQPQQQSASEIEDYDIAAENTRRRTQIKNRNWKKNTPSQNNLYVNLRKTPQSNLINVGEPNLRQSPMAPLIAYKDSREDGHANRVIMHRNSFSSKGSSLDFELR